MNLNKVISPFKSDPGIALFGIVLVVNLIQSVFSPLLNDEAYYWLYAQYLNWGYFDHPPLIAFLIRAGGILLPGEIGVRLFVAIIGSATFLIIYRLIAGETEKPVNIRLAALLLLSSLFLNLYSFMALPDTPMLFFAALFLYTYRKYLAESNTVNTLTMGVIAALLLYAKYHGILLIGFTLLSNPKLLLKRKFYSIPLITVLLYAPHTYWEIQHNYPTIRFQFFERVNEFNLQHVFSYLGEQAGLTGPVILLLFSILYRPKNQFQKTLKYNTAGIFIFFFLSSFKAMVNLHWTAIAWPGMLCLAYLYIDGLKKYREPVYILLIVNLFIILLFRINFIGNLVPVSNFNDKNPRLMTALFIKNAARYPIVFKDMYNEPSYYIFYGNRPCYAFNNIQYKKTQFNYLPQLEDKVQRKTVNFISLEPLNNCSEEIKIPKGKKYYVTTISNFASFNTDIKVKPADFSTVNASAKTTVNFTIENSLTEQQKNLLKLKGGKLMLTLMNPATKESFSFYDDQALNFSGGMPFSFKFTAPSQRGTYNCVFSIVTDDSFLVGFNSNIYKCVVQ